MTIPITKIDRQSYLTVVAAVAYPARRQHLQAEGASRSSVFCLRKSLARILRGTIPGIIAIYQPYSRLLDPRACLISALSRACRMATASHGRSLASHPRRAIAWAILSTPPLR